MCPLLAFVCPCFRTNVIVKCRIVPFLFSLDSVILTNVFLFNLWKTNFRMGRILFFFFFF